MSSQRQIEANRRNAQKSTGPTSVTGKAVASLNALKTGLHAKSLLIQSEKRADFEQLVEEYYQRYQPTSPEVRCLVDDLIRCEWLLRRFDRSETQMFYYQNNDIYRDPQKYPLGHSASSYSSSYSKLQYRVDATRRARDRALKALQQLESQAAAAPAPDPAPDPAAEPDVAPSLTTSPQTASPEIGFVLSTPSAASSPTPPEPESRESPMIR
jgi:hypothetical protein